MDKRITERFDGVNVTQIMNSSIQENKGRSRKTECMGKPSENVTAVLNASNTGYVPVDLSVGSVIGGYSILDIIAENTGEATLLLGEKNDSKVVLKIYHKGKSPKVELSNLISQIESNGIIKPISSGTYGERTYEVLPYFKNGDLLNNLPLTNEILTDVIIPGINTALHALHEKGIVHRDIKPSNIFFSDDMKSIIVGDFGISSVLKSDVSVRVTNMSRTFGYAAPETSTGFVSKESDYYSFGVTLLHLLLGQDPFLGMTDVQILYQTINKKLDIPQSIPIRLANLIRGLTIKERSDRWGYNEVVRWLNNEDVELVEKNIKTKGVTPYLFNRNRYYNLESLSMAFASNWENTKKHLFRGLVEKNIAQYGEDYVSDCIDLKEISDKDVAVFKLIRILNPGAPLCYKGKIFNDLSAVGIEMYNNLPNIEQDIYELLINGCFVEYLKSNAFDSNLIEYFTNCIDKMVLGNENYYYAIMYLLCEQAGYAYKDLFFNQLEDLIEYLDTISAEEVEFATSEFLSDSKFVMWIYSQGYYKQVEEWLDIFTEAEW